MLLLFTTLTGPLLLVSALVAVTVLTTLLACYFFL